MKTVKLTRKGPGNYAAVVRSRDSGLPPFILNVTGPDPHYKDEGPAGYSWMVETDTERFFSSLKEAREYINRFFEPAASGNTSY